MRRIKSIALTSAVALPLALAALAGPVAAIELKDLHGLDVQQLDDQYRRAVSVLGDSRTAAGKHAEVVGLDAESTLRLLAKSTDPNGASHYRYQQTFRGLPIWGEHIVVSEDASGRLLSLFGRRADGLNEALPLRSRSIGAEAALAIAKASAQAGKAGAGVQNPSVVPSVLVHRDKSARQVYVVNFILNTADAVSRPFVIIDSANGKVIGSWDGLTTANVGTGPGGNLKSGQYEWGTGGRYAHLNVLQSGSSCTMSNETVKTVNLNGGESGETAWSYACPRNTVKVINGGYSPLNDLHAFSGVTQDMYSAYTGNRAMATQVVARAHYKSNLAQANWDGAHVNFGDGNSNYYPLTILDIVSHEISHGFTEQHSNLTYRLPFETPESGAINESYSDIAGEAAEFYWKGTADFLVGDGYVKAGAWRRNMMDPRSDGFSIDNTADFAPLPITVCEPELAKGKQSQGRNGSPGTCVVIPPTDVHFASGIYNKAFHRLSTSAGWDIVKAFRVFHRANALYWTPSTNFSSGVCGVQQAAADFGFTVAPVAAAFNVVGAICPTSYMAGISIGDVSTSEGNSGFVTAVFTLTLSKPMTDPVLLDLSTFNGTAAAGSDYAATSQLNKLIDPGRTSQVFYVNVYGDGAVEANETFSVGLSNVRGATVTDGTGVATIVNDDNN